VVVVGTKALVLLVLLLLVECGQGCCPRSIDGVTESRYFAESPVAEGGGG
jgi:hypothetical protein